MGNGTWSSNRFCCVYTFLSAFHIVLHMQNVLRVRTPHRADDVVVDCQNRILARLVEYTAVVQSQIKKWRYISALIIQGIAVVLFAN